MTGEIENNSVYLSMVFRVDGVFFEASYNIDLVTGEVMFGMDRPSIMRKDFIAPMDMDAELVERIKDLMKPDKLMECMNDEMFDKYYSAKFLPVFITFVEYLENLTFVDKCKECIHVFNLNLNHSDGCKELFVRNRFSSGRKADEV